jgi:hypothetical protein
MSTQGLDANLTIRKRAISIIWFSILIPGLGHFLQGKHRAAFIWFFTCQLLLVCGFGLAGFTQLDFGSPLRFGNISFLYFLIPESGNFLFTQILAHTYDSRELGGRYPTDIPFRHLGYLLSAVSGILGVLSATHAVSGVFSSTKKNFKVSPGHAAVCSLLIPGWGHLLTNRKFKAGLAFCSLMGLFFLGMYLGDWADFDRQRHSYYWIGQILMGLPAWLCYLACENFEFSRVLLFQDAGLLFTSSAGFFNAVIAVDAYQRAEQDLLEEAD